MKDILIIHPDDNVGINLDTNNTLVPYGHKVALKDLKQGEYVIKYGHIIGKATCDIKKGEWVHSHNLASHLNESQTYSYNPNLKHIDFKNGTFLGYKRHNRLPGIRNNIYVIPTVGCVNSVAKKIVELAKPYIKGSIDGIYALTHPFGCSQLGQDQENITKILIDLAKNPNASGVLFVGLGCENNNLELIRKYLSKKDYEYIRMFNCQDVKDDLTFGLEHVKEIITFVSELKREPCPLSDLCIGLKCGGSDSFSGITANPLVGKISDRICQYGGSSILTEVPEMFGAEQVLMNKCANKDVYDKYVKLITDFKNYYLDLGFPVYENPSPGNKKGGITTLEEKSLGCITKAGSTPINDVLNYGDIVKTKGVNVLNGPGNDMVAVTALAASGCQLILFTTGRGTPLESVVPTIKISTNNNLATYKANWIDFDSSNMDEEALFNLVLDTCNGKYKTKQEDNVEIAFFKKGVIL